jgi:hypothetical protein
MLPNCNYLELNPRISLLRRNTKDLAIINVRMAYGLHGGSSELVAELLRQKHYIYPLTPNVSACRSPCHT